MVSDHAALLKIKRKSRPKTDENEDGARANLIERASRRGYSNGEAASFFCNTPQLGLDLLKAVKNFVRGYEAEQLPLWLWSGRSSKAMRSFASFRLSGGEL